MEVQEDNVSAQAWIRRRQKRDGWEWWLDENGHTYKSEARYLRGLAAFVALTTWHPEAEPFGYDKAECLLPTHEPPF